MRSWRGHGDGKGKGAGGTPRSGDNSGAATQSTPRGSGHCLTRPLSSTPARFVVIPKNCLSRRSPRSTQRVRLAFASVSFPRPPLVNFSTLSSCGPLSWRVCLHDGETLELGLTARMGGGVRTASQLPRRRSACFCNVSGQRVCEPAAVPSSSTRTWLRARGQSRGSRALRVPWRPFVDHASVFSSRRRPKHGLTIHLSAAAGRQRLSAERAGWLRQASAH